MGNGQPESDGEFRHRLRELGAEVAGLRAEVSSLQARADDADKRANASEARADHAEERANASEARADHADERADASEARADHADELANASEARADDDHARIAKLEARADVDQQVIAELRADGVLTREHAEHLEEALHSSRVIGAAIGIVMAHRRVTEAMALEILKVASQHTNRKVRALAEDVVRTGDVSDLPDA